jgi:S-formylglutathione hydrolase FrmB
MVKLTIITAILLAANMLLGQYKIDTSFYSEALGEEKLVDVYFPPGYDENPNLCYPVIYYLHGYGGNQNTMGEMITWLNSLINSGTIDPVIMVGADNSPGPFGGSCYLNSILWGNYEDYMVYDLIEWIDASFRTLPFRNARGLLGQSMGGYGALRYGIVHKDKFGVLAAHAGPNNFNDAWFREKMQESIRSENNPGPPYVYDFSSGLKTKLSFLMCGAASPDTNTPQTYVIPPIVQYMLDENGNYIDSILVKQDLMDNIFLIGSLTPSDSVGILLGCGENDDFFLYQGHMALKDSMDFYSLPYEFYSHEGGHSMPVEFKKRALTFIDSLNMPAQVCPTGVESIINENIHPNLKSFPNPFSHSTAIQFELSKMEYIELSVWNHLGHRVEILYEGNKKAERHQVLLDASKLPDGIYFCRLRWGNEMVTKKIIKVN